MSASYDDLAAEVTKLAGEVRHLTVSNKKLTARVARGEGQRAKFFWAVLFLFVSTAVLLFLYIMVLVGRAQSRGYYNDQVDKFDRDFGMLKQLVCSAPTGDAQRERVRAILQCDAPGQPTSPSASPSSSKASPKSSPTTLAPKAAANPTVESQGGPVASSRSVLAAQPAASRAPTRASTPSQLPTSASPSQPSGLVPGVLREVTCDLLGLC